jgi:small subunit ribosomal protein S13
MENKIEKQRPQETKRDYGALIRIMQTDIPSNKRVLVGLTYIKGVKWSISNALCKILEVNPNKKISELTSEEIKK